jgi:hypothetical protein
VIRASARSIGVEYTARAVRSAEGEGGAECGVRCFWSRV